MTVSTAPIRIKYVGDESSTTFPINYPFFLTTDLLVMLGGAVITNGYSTTGGGGNTGALVMAVAPPAGVSVQIILNNPVTQIVSLVDGTMFPSATLNQIHDRAVQIDLRTRDLISRSIFAPDGDVVPNMALPAAAARANTFLTFDSNGNVALAVTLPAGTLSQANIGFFLYPQTPIESALGITPVNYFCPPGNMLRYGTNATPGTTDMSNALQSAINVSLAGTKGYAPEGAYLITTPPTFGASTTAILSLDFGGAGIGTQFIPNNAQNSGPLFDMSGKNGWKLHDFVICGNSAHKNNGIACNNIGSAQAIEWEIVNVTSLVAGVGFYLSNTNTGVIRNCRHWPGNNPTLIIPQTVTPTDISHGCYMTGGFVHQVGIYDCVFNPNSNYSAGMRGIKCDAQSSYGVVIKNTLTQTLSGLNNETGIDYNPSGSAQGLTIIGGFNEGTIVKLGNVSQSTIGPLTDGTASGSLILGSGTRENTFTGLSQQVLKIADSTCFGNTFIGCGIRTAPAWSNATAYTVGTFVANGGVNYICILANTNQSPPNATYWAVYGALFIDGNEGANQTTQPNRFINCSLPGYPSGVSDLGSKWSNPLTYAASMVLDMLLGNTRVVRVTNTSPFAFQTPINPRNGQEVEVILRNESGSAMGAVTWNGVFTPASVILPANGFHRKYVIQYDATFSSFHMVMWSPADIAN